MKNSKNVLLLIALLLVCILPLSAQETEVTEKETPPPGGEPRNFTLPEKTIVNFDNGLSLVMIPWGSVPKATIQVVIKSGNIHEGENEVWLSDLVADLLKEGSVSKSGNDIADAMAGMGGELNIGVGLHTTTGSANVLYEFAPDAISLLADVLMNPSFPEAELERLIKDRQRQVNVSMSRPQPKARQDFFAKIYPDHPYGRIYPTEEMLGSYTLDQLKTFYGNNYGAQRTTVYVAGKFDQKAVEEAVKASLGTWDKGKESFYPVAEPVTGASVSIIDRPDAPQSTIMMGLPILDPSHPDWVALSVTNSLLGGSFGSRITKNIREDKGYTYSPRSSVSTNYKSAVWYESADVTTADTGPSLREITKEIYLLQDETPSAEELEGIQNYNAGIFVLQNSTPRGIIGQMVTMDIHELEDTYLTDYVKKIYEVTPEKVQEITKKYIDPEKMTLVLVGDKKIIEKQIEEYNRAKEDYNN